MTVATIFIISGSYAQIIEAFPSGGGGYIVASKLLGEKAGVVSGSALVIDYILTITISSRPARTPSSASFRRQCLAVQDRVRHRGDPVFLIWMNLRGVKESVAVFTPIFMVFMLTHIPLLLYADARAHRRPARRGRRRVPRFSGPPWGRSDGSGSARSCCAPSRWAAAPSPGSRRSRNSMQTLREPRVHTGKKAMLYMAVSLSFLAGGILLCYLLYKVGPVPGKTLNAVLFGKVVGDLWQGSGGKILLAVVLGSETALLFIAAQTGIIDGPQVLSNMALDYYVPQALRAPLRAAGDEVRRGLHGRHGAADAVHLRRVGQVPRHHVLNQRVPDLHPLAVRDDPALVEGPGDGEESGNSAWR